MQSSESVIRLMTRVAVQHDAVNLAQGFPDEPPNADLVWGAIAAMLGGTRDGIEQLSQATAGDLGAAAWANARSIPTLAEALCRLQQPDDLFNQYSFPFGLRELREAVADYTLRFYGFRPDPDTEITISLGATEGLASSLGSICDPGDGVIVMQPFHELYPSQARVFGLRPIFVTLREQRETGRWQLDPGEVAAAARAGARILVLNTPHNPTGKVFDDEELDAIAGLCRDHDLLAITDEIYEHIVYDGRRHRCLATLPGMRDRTIVVNSISKTGNATGWRVGWVIAAPALTQRIRGVHDTIVIQAPTPLQKAAVALLTQPDAFYERLRCAYTQKRAVLSTALKQVGFRVTRPEGAFYFFADYRGVSALAGLSPMEAAMTLIRSFGVGSVPGDNFYAEGCHGDTYLRFAFCRSLASLDEGARRLQRLSAD
jgi:aspartate/methionine/tyrosine aminotransferase